MFCVKQDIYVTNQYKTKYIAVSIIFILQSNALADILGGNCIFFERRKKSTFYQKVDILNLLTNQYKTYYVKKILLNC